METFRLAQAGQVIRNGGVVAYPTEAVYGLGCDPLNPAAVYRLLEMKKRPVEKGLILIASRLDQLLPFVQFAGDWTDRVKESWPGPHTWLLPAAPELPYWINGGRDTVACRVTAHPLASSLCEHVGHALISTSANRSGQRPARTPLEVRLRCPDVDHVICGKLGDLAKPTSIRVARTGAQLR